MTEIPESDRLWGKLRRLLGGGHLSIESRQPAAHADPSPASPRSGDERQPAPLALDIAAFDRGLAEVITRQQVLTGGKVHVVNIQQIRERLGTRWDYARERIHAIIESTLNQRLAKRDLYARHQDLYYVIAFGDLSADEAAFKCRLLTKEVLDRILGSDAGIEDGLDIRSAVARIDGTTGLEKVDSAGALARLLDRAGTVLEPAWLDRAASPGMAQRLQLHDLAALLDRAESELKLLLDATGERLLSPAMRQSRIAELIEALRSTEKEFARPEPSSQGAPHGAAAGGIGLRDAVAERLQELMARAESLIPGSSPTAAWRLDDLPTGVSFRYQPIWNLHQKVMGTYLCEMMVKYGAGSVPSDAALPLDPDVTLLGRVDRLVLRRALADIETAAQRRMVSAICVPVHFGVLAGASTRRDFIALCNTIRPEVRSLLVWEIIGVPGGVWENSLFSIVSTLKPFSRAVFMRRDFDQTDFEVSAAVGVHSVGLDPGRAGASETRLVPLLERFADRAHRAGLRCHVHGLTTGSLCLSAIGAGFDYMSGPAIAESTETPWGILPFDAESLFLHKFSNSFGSSPG